MAKWNRVQKEPNITPQERREVGKRFHAFAKEFREQCAIQEKPKRKIDYSKSQQPGALAEWMKQRKQAND